MARYEPPGGWPKTGSGVGDTPTSTPIPTSTASRAALDGQPRAAVPTWRFAEKTMRRRGGRLGFDQGLAGRADSVALELGGEAGAVGIRLGGGEALAQFGDLLVASAAPANLRPTAGC